MMEESDALVEQRALDEVIAENAQVAGDVVEIGEHVWAVHGVVPVDGDVILAEFSAREQALDLLEQLAAAEQTPLTPPVGPRPATFDFDGGAS